MEIYSIIINRNHIVDSLEAFSLANKILKKLTPSVTYKRCKVLYKFNTFDFIIQPFYADKTTTKKINDTISIKYISKL
jgi:hypothetical protein